MYEEVLVAVDPHKRHNTVMVLDPVSHRAVDEAEFANTHNGYREMMRFARRWRQRRWAVEGCHGAGRSVAQRLVANGEEVLDVPAKLAARVRVFSQGHCRLNLRRFGREVADRFTRLWEGGLTFHAWADIRYRVYAGFMRSSQVAAEAGVNVQNLRYYERRGLLPEPDRLGSGYRAYGTDAVRTVRFVKSAQQLGFSLEEIDTLLDLAAGGPDNCEAAKTLATEKLAHLQHKIASLSAMRDSLRHLVATCERSRGKRVCPMLGALEEGDRRR